MYIMSTRMCTYMCTHIYYTCPYSGYTKIHIYVDLTHIYHLEVCPDMYHINTYVYIYWIYVFTYILYVRIYIIYIDPHILDVCGSNTYIQRLYLYAHIPVRSTVAHISHILDICGSNSYFQHIYLYAHIRVNTIFMWTHLDMIYMC